MKVVFHFPKIRVCLPFAKQIEVVFQFGSYYTPVRLLGQVSMKNVGKKTFPGRLGGWWLVAGLKENKANSLHPVEAGAVVWYELVN